MALRRHALRLAVAPSLLGLLIVGAGQASAAPASAARAGAGHVTRGVAASPRDQYNCNTLTGIAVNGGPLTVSSNARVTNCTGNPLPTRCTSTAEIYGNTGSGWALVKVGATVSGCFGAKATVTALCNKSYPTNVKYQARGRYTFTWEGTTSRSTYNGPTESLRKICS